MTLAFWFALAFLVTHELDAVRCDEWRILPPFAWMNERTGPLWFIAVHVPLFALIFWSVSGPTPSYALLVGINLFCIIHAGLHVLLRHHRHYRFRGWLSWTLIFGAGVCGALDLVIGME